MAERVAHTLLVRHDVHGWRAGAEDPVAVWIGHAVRRGQSILYELEPAESRDAVLALLLGEGAEHRMEVLEPAAVRSESSGTAGGLAGMHRSRVDDARAQGWSGLAVVTGSAVLAAVVDGTADPVSTATMHDHGVSRVVVQTGMSALCRYQADRQPGLAEVMLAGHFDDVADEIWGARVVAGVLHLRGEIDASNAGHLTHVLRGALAAGVRVVGLSALDFCAAAGVRTLRRAAESLPEGETLVVVDASAVLLRLFAVVELSDCLAVELRGQP